MQVGYVGGVVAHWCWLFVMTAPMERLSHGLERGWWNLLMPFGFPVVAGTPVWGAVMALGRRRR